MTKVGLDSCSRDTLTCTAKRCPTTPSSIQRRVATHACCSTQSPIGTMTPVSSATGMKSAASIRPLVGWFQRTSASAASARSETAEKIGWYSTVSSPSRSALRQRRRELGAHPALRAQLVGEDRRARPARLLGGVHGGVGVRHELDGGVVGRRALASSASVMLTPTLTETSSSSWRIVRRPVSARRIRSARSIATDRVGDVGAEHHELVAADAGDDVVRAHRRGEPLGGRGEQPIADLVAERVVDVAQPIDVDHQHGDLAADLVDPSHARRRVRSSAAARLSRPVVGSCSSRCSSSAGAERSSDTSRHSTAMKPPSRRRRVVADQHGVGLDAVGGRRARVRSISPLPDAAFGVDQQPLRDLVEHVAQRFAPVSRPPGTAWRPEQLRRRRVVGVERRHRRDRR